MISVIVCSIDSKLVRVLKENIRKTIGVKYEIIVIDNLKHKFSISSAYNIGAHKAKYEFLCFIHEDILFHTMMWGTNLIAHLSKKEISLIGILGCLVKTKAPSGVYIPLDSIYRVNQIQRTKDNLLVHYYLNPNSESYSEVRILDGMFLATTKENHKLYCFDEVHLKGFHAYDIDFSLGQTMNGKVIVIYDILIEHLSFGGNTKMWIEAQLAVSKKWKDILPTYVSCTKEDLLKAEILNTEIFLISLFKNNFSKLLQLKYLSNLFFLNPLAYSNIRHFGRFLFNTTFKKKEVNNNAN
jgi:glycosyltransferase involved in cell wall biosynthesis